MVLVAPCGGRNQDGSSTIEVGKIEVTNNQIGSTETAVYLEIDTYGEANGTVTVDDVNISGNTITGNVDGLLSMGFPDVHCRYFPPEAIPLARFGAVNAVAFDPHTGRFTGVGDVRRNGFAAGPRVGPTGPPSR